MHVFALSETGHGTGQKSTHDLHLYHLSDMIVHMAKVGRPSKYSPEIADEICIRLACGESMRSVCLDKDMPAMPTVWRWIRERDEFRKQYDRAKHESADVHAEEILDIADDSVGDVPRDRLRIDARKWIASKLKPKKYGDKASLDVDTGRDIKITIGGDSGAE